MNDYLELDVIKSEGENEVYKMGSLAEALDYAYSRKMFDLHCAAKHVVGPSVEVFLLTVYVDGDIFNLGYVAIDEYINHRKNCNIGAMNAIVKYFNRKLRELSYEGE